MAPSDKMRPRTFFVWCLCCLEDHKTTPALNEILCLTILQQRSTKYIDFAYQSLF